MTSEAVANALKPAEERIDRGKLPANAPAAKPCGYRADDDRDPDLPSAAYAPCPWPRVFPGL
jgi:hypothetical protein